MPFTGPKLVSPITEPLVTAAELAAELRLTVPTAAETVRMEGLCLSAQTWVESSAGRLSIARQVTERMDIMDAYRWAPVRLAYPDILSVSQIVWLRWDQAQPTELAADAYRRVEQHLMPPPGKLWPWLLTSGSWLAQAWPGQPMVQLKATYTAGMVADRAAALTDHDCAAMRRDVTSLATLLWEHPSMGVERAAIESGLAARSLGGQFIDSAGVGID